MRKVILSILLTFFISSITLYSQVSINTDNTIPDASAMLDVKSTDKGMLIPRLTSSQRTSIASPATGLLVFDTDTNSFWYYDSTAWSNLSQDQDWLDTNGGQATSISSSIYTNGNVGIGTSSPFFPIDVQGTGGERLRAYTTDGFFAGYIAKNSTREFFAGVQATYETSDASSGYHIYDNTAGSQRFVIDKDGDVGIGQANPNAKLHINGDIRIVDGTQGAGKVLTSDASGFGSWETVVDNIDDADADPANELNTGLSLTNNTLSLSDAGGSLDVDLSSLADEDWTFNTGTGDAGQVYHSGQVSVGNNSASLDGSEYRFFAERNSIDGAAIIGYNGTSRGLLGVWDGNIVDLDLPLVQSAGVLGYCPDFANNNRAAIYGYSDNREGTVYAGVFQAVGVNSQVNYGIYVKAANSTNDNYVGYFDGDKSYFSGSIGLGISSPLDKLHAASAAATTGLRAENTATGSAGLYTENTLGEIFLGLQAGTDPNPGNFHIYDVPTSTQLMEIQDNQQFKFYGDVTTETIFSNAQSTNLQSTNLTGNEGIVMPGGTSDYIVSVQDGNGRIQHKWNATHGTGETYIVGAEDAAFIDIGVSADNDNSAWIEFKHADGSAAAAGDAISWNTQMIINQGGQVGINETSPDDMLHVTSGGNGTRVRSENSSNGWAGFLSKNTNGEMFMGLQGAFDANPGEFHMYDNVAGARRLVIDAAGEVGIGKNNPSVKLDVNGSVNCTGGTCSSDLRWKKDIQPLKNVLENVGKLQGVSYSWRTAKFPEKDFGTDRQIGLIAQEVEAIYPDLVKTDNEGYKSMDYMSFTAILLEAVKALKAENDDLKSTMTSMNEEQKNLRAEVTELEKLQAELTQLKEERAAVDERLKAIESMLNLSANK